jgi:hypothetical protein
VISTANTTNAAVATNNTNETNAQDKETEQASATFPGIEPEISNDKIKVNQSSVLRIEEQVRVLWRGVTSCCDQSRIDQEVKSEFKRWIEQKKSEHKDLLFLRGGAPESRVSCRASDGRPIGERSCSASTTLACYIEFLKPEPEVQYNLMYVAKKRTKWISHPAERNPETGFINKGESVHFSEEPPSSGTMQPAKLKDGRIRFVDTVDFKRP